MMNKAYIALGSNIPPRFNYLKQAIEAIHELDQVSVINQSAIYETEPVGYKDQNKFLNQVIEVNTSQTALELLELCQSIEDRLGRKRNVRWGRSEEHTSELQSRGHLVCRLLLEKTKNTEQALSLCYKRTL